jgi:two-component system, response regulator PdtaR
MTMKKLRILIVEDEALISLFLSDLLEEMGHEVCAIETAEIPAVLSARRLMPDLMLIDNHLREGSGMGVIAALAEDGPLPHVFMTGDNVRNVKLGAGTIVLQKPFLDSALVTAIDAAMSYHHPLQAELHQ